ncbi:MAG: ABC transporter ATP-binding protein [Castellaniella sp.]|uniref:ABC transporter ATP-binding protein n=1 Tax=Castellaniella sp. TaxID=1955812 RepID=UPI0011F69E57|nr:ABC transporter ATP-binding protein [Castellaniella sp.]TAN27375.1 MAG: ABC transporter ATP-binding protein [Castellaniella sp.]
MLRAVEESPQGASGALIEISGAGKTYRTKGGDVRALDGIDLSIADGEFVSIVGPSGCGKSTLLRILAGLDDCTDGEARMEGRAISGPPPGVGVVFQSANLLPWLTVRQNVELPIRVGGRHDRSTKAEELLSMTGLEGFGDRFPYELSGGMQQRAGICRALIRNPQMLLMDEPFGALDALTRERMNLELQRIWQSSNKTVVLITHSISEAIFLADRVVVMSSRPGKILRDIPVSIPRPRAFETILSNSEYTRLSRDIRKLLNAQGGVE